MNIPLKSIIMTIGPSGCGKTTFINNVLRPAINQAFDYKASHHHISSDSYRHEILDMAMLDRDDERMGYASEGAFKMMMAKLDAVTTWPVSADFVILDATFLSEKSREQFIKKARDCNYQLVGLCFDYADREDYFRNNSPARAHIIQSHLKRFKTETLPELRRKDFTGGFHKIKSNKPGTEFILEPDPSYAMNIKAQLPQKDKYFIVGDLHSCLKELKDLLVTAGFTIGADNLIKGLDDTFIVFVGDIVDKGGEVNELMDFLSINMSRFKTVIGNHDRSLMRFIKNNANDKANDPKIAKYFDAFAQMNDVSKAQFMAIMDNSAYFLRHDNFVVTHAPCANNNIGKFDQYSERNQNNCSYGWRREFASDEAFVDGIKKSIPWVFDEQKKYDPFHFFGHIAVKDATVFGNKVFLDTGSAYGNKLTGVFFDVRSKRLQFKHVPSTYQSEDSVGDIVDFSIIKKAKHNFESLEFDDKMEVVRHARNKINFISGTMSPGGSNLEHKTLEDIREAFAYYREKGINEVMIQKKYMGSRATMYLFPDDMKKCYMTSRNGYVIKKLDLKPIFEKTLANLAYDELAGKSMIIIDGELMPWSAMGRGLIDSHFVTVGKGAASEIDLLRETGFEDILKATQAKFEQSDYKSLRNTLKKEDLIKALGEANYRNLSSYDGFKWIPLEIQEEHVKIYNKQLELYGSEGSLEFKPFALLKTIDEDGVEQTYFDSDQIFVFESVSNDDYAMSGTMVEHVDSARKHVQNWIDTEHIEGVVIKPLRKVYNAGVAPYMKVRNPNYLTIIYGHDYLIEPKFTRMLEKKAVANKIKMSIKEYDLGKNMLEVPYNDISETNEAYLDIVAQMVVEESREKTLDPRL